MEPGEKQNILNLIGRDSRRYTSCLITSFSFDFIFFEERLMPRLKAAGVRNINLLLDGHYYEQLLEKSEGKTFYHQKTYSIVPVYLQGVYHPKIMLLTGPKHGLVLIGSGNLSASGLGTNDEVWGAFHLDSYKGQNAPLFAQVWQYLSGFFSSAKGFNREKLEWVLANSPWLQELQTDTAAEFFPIHKKQELYFLANRQEASIYQQLKTILPSARLKKLTVIAPYYDKEGQAISQLVKDYNPEETQCITDCTFGLPPIDLPTELAADLPFYDWQDCVKEFDSKKYRLHAKLFHFDYADGWEYLMIGSANATLAALGTATRAAINSEAGLLIRRIKGNKDYIQELKISTEKAQTIDLSKQSRPEVNRGDSLPVVKFEMRILHAEFIDSCLKLYLHTGSQGNSKAHVFNRHNQEIARITLPEGEEFVELKLESEQEPRQLALYNDEERISNFCPIHLTALLAKSNPDPKQVQISELLEGIQEQNNGEEYISLLNYIETSWADDQGKDSHSRNSVSYSDSIRAEAVKEYKALDEATFNTLPSLQQSEHSLLSNPTVQAAEVLSMLAKELRLIKDDTTESTEELLSQQDVEQQAGEGESVEVKQQPNWIAEKEREVIHSYIETIEDYFSERLERFYKTGNLQDMPAAPVTVTELSHVLILAKLLYKFIGKQYAEQKIGISINYFDKYGKSIKKIVDKYKSEDQVRVSGGEMTTYKHEFIVSDSDVSLCIEEFNKLDERIFNEVNVNSAKILITRYFELSPYQYAHSDAIKTILIDVVGTILLSINPKNGFKEYPYKSVNEKVSTYRKLAFHSLTYLLLNVEWKQEEYDCRNLLLIDLLYKMVPQSGISAREILREVQALHENSFYKYPAFKENLEWYAGYILTPYQKWSTIYADSELKSTLIEDKVSVRIGSVIYRSELGFTYINGRGGDFLVLKKPGFCPNEDYQGMPVQKIQYQRNKLVTMPGLR